jgi:hypothetical protein
MHGSADMAGMSDDRSRRTFFRLEIVCQDQPMEMKLESTPDVSHVETRAVRGPFFGMSFGHMISLAFLGPSRVAAFRRPNSGSRNGVYFATSRHEREIIVPGPPHSHAAFLNIRRNSSFEGERCMKDTDHPVRHPSVHLRISRRVRNGRSCASGDDQFGHGQNTGLSWSDPTFAHVSVPKVTLGVAPAQLRGDRAECFARATFRSRGPQ